MDWRERRAETRALRQRYEQELAKAKAALREEEEAKEAIEAELASRRVDARVTADGMAQLLTAAPRLIPGRADASFERGWAGLRPSSPDGLPSIGWIDGVDSLLIAYGHHRSGVLLSPVRGALVRDLVLGKPSPRAAEAFDPARFAGLARE